MSDLQRKIQLNKERKEAELLPSRLTGVRVLGYADATSMPSWTDDARKACLGIASTPDTQIPCSASSTDVDSWYASLLHTAGVKERFYCSTRMTNFPWVECLVTEDGWIRSVREALGDDIYFISHDKRSLVVVFEEEYEYIGFHCTEPTLK
ncbi:hypothetical protein ABZ752_06670 [Streptomyces roseifaciens]